MLREAGLWEMGIWAALRKINPWGENRADLRAALGHSLFANANRNRDLRPQAYQARDFMPYLQLSPEERERELGAQLLGALAPERQDPAKLKAWRKQRRASVGKGNKP